MEFILLQIPCYNEADHLPVTLSQLPRSYTDPKGKVWPIKWMVMDDGSKDQTIQVAKELGVDHVLELPHQGLAQTWAAGIGHAFKLGATYVINLDADNQYSVEDLSKLLDALITQQADMVMGCRNFDSIPHFSYVKCRLQELGSYVVSKLAGIQVQDVTSGYRGLNRRAMASLCVHSKYTYTLETIIQAGTLGFKIVCVRVGTNPKLRESRLMRSTASYIWRSLHTMFRITMLYRAFQFFVALAIAFLLPSAYLLARFVYFWVITSFGSTQSGHTQSLIVAAIGFMLAVGCGTLAVLVDMISANRRLLESIRAQMLLGSAERH